MLWSLSDDILSYEPHIYLIQDIEQSTPFLILYIVVAYAFIRLNKRAQG